MTDSRHKLATPKPEAKVDRRHFINTAGAQHNLEPGEELPKGHSRIVQVGRKLYMTSQNFHDFKGSLDQLPEYRGAHLFSYDLDSGVFEVRVVDDRKEGRWRLNRRPPPWRRSTSCGSRRG